MLLNRGHITGIVQISKKIAARPLGGGRAVATSYPVRPCAASEKTVRSAEISRVQIQKRGSTL